MLLYISSTSMLLALGMWFPLHPGFFLFLSLTGVGHTALAIWDAEHGWALRYFWITEGWLLAVVIFIGSGLALRKALMSGVPR